MSETVSKKPGDTVRIVSNQVIADRIALERPVSIVTAPGVRAVFDASQGHYFLVPGDLPTTVQSATSLIETAPRRCCRAPACLFCSACCLATSSAGEPS